MGRVNDEDNQPSSKRRLVGKKVDSFSEDEFYPGLKGSQTKKGPQFDNAQFDELPTKKSREREEKEEGSRRIQGSDSAETIKKKQAEEKHQTSDSDKPE